MMSAANQVFAARTPLPSHPSVYLHRQRTESSKYDSLGKAFHPPNTTSLSPSHLTLSSYAAVMPLYGQAISSRDLDFATARTLWEMQSCVRSSHVGIADASSAREDELQRNAEKSSQRTGMAAPCVRTSPTYPDLQLTSTEIVPVSAPQAVATASLTSANSQQGLATKGAALQAVGKDDAACLLESGIIDVTNGIAALQIDVDSQLDRDIEELTRSITALQIDVDSDMVCDVDHTASCTEANCYARKRRMEAPPTSEPHAKRAFLRVVCLTTRMEANPGKGRSLPGSISSSATSNDMQSQRKRRKCSDTSGEPSVKKPRVAVFINEIVC